MPRKKWRPREGRQRAAERDPEPGLLEPKLAAEPRVCSVTVTYHTPGTWGGGLPPAEASLPSAHFPMRKRRLSKLRNRFGDARSRTRTQSRAVWL